MATQIGYAIGVLLFVPLGDVLNCRILVPIALLCATAALLASALPPAFTVLLTTLFLAGLTTVSGQILVPLAGDLASDSDRGRVVGSVVSGILIGILVSRTVSGLIAGAAGWRAVYFLAAGLAFVLAILLFFAIPSLPARASMRYPALIGSVFSIVDASERCAGASCSEARPSRCSLCSGHRSRSCSAPRLSRSRWLSSACSASWGSRGPPPRSESAASTTGASACR